MLCIVDVDGSNGAVVVADVTAVFVGGIAVVAVAAAGAVVVVVGVVAVVLFFAGVAGAGELVFDGDGAVDVKRSVKS